MGLDQKLLGEGEFVVRHMRTHSKALWPALFWFVVLTALLVVGLLFLPEDWHPWSTITVVVIYVFCLFPLVLLPTARWRSTTYTMTNRRIITRRGIINKTGHDLPLRRINNVSYERELLDRMLGCGTLIFTTAAETPVTLPDVPHVERVHVEMTELLFAGEDDAEHWVND